MSVVCNKCGANPQFENVVLTRVNPKGETGIWQCNPVCGVPFESSSSAILFALEDSVKPEARHGTTN